MHIPTLDDILEARKTISPYINRTPLISYKALNQYVGLNIRLKHENHHALGAFKIRGGINLLKQMSQTEKDRGVITASTGNHGQSVASACSLLGVRSLIIVPENANPLKVQSMESLGAVVKFHGNNFDEARAYTEQLASDKGYRYVHPANESDLVAGIATCFLEILEDFPEVTYIFVPMGGGSAAAAACIVTQALRPDVKIVAVQSAEAPAGYLSWKNKEILTSPMQSISEGLATASGYRFPQEILWASLHDFILVTDHEIMLTVALMIEKAHCLAEEAGAAALAGVIQGKESLAEENIAVVVSGSNITLERLSNSINLYRSS
jgi:threonine dehydratase